MTQADKSSIQSKLQMASQFIGKGQADEAQRIFDQLVQADITDTDTLAQYGEIAHHLGEKVRALNAFYKVVEAQGDNALYLDLYAQILLDNGNISKSVELLQKAIELAPDFATPYIRLARIYTEIFEFKKAIALLEKALELKPSDPAAHAILIYAYRHDDRHEEALKHAHKLLRIAPDNPANYETLARVLMELGKVEEATPHLEKAIRLDRTFGSAYQAISSIKKFTEKDRDFINRCETALKSSMSAANRSFIHFSLGKMYNDCKQWEKAFEHFKQGNLLSKPAIEENTPAATRRFRKARKIYTRKFIRDTADLGSDSETPVFVVGMPRSGTTLIEQIIASHPLGAGAGELSEISRIETHICPDASVGNYSKQLTAALDKQIIQQYSEDYLTALRKNRETASRIVDKMPDNFLHLGLINLLFPKAQIIHSVRNPLDTCLSCYFQPFSFLKWSHDLDWIAERYRFYREVMDYWKSALPPDKIVDIHYEGITSQPETGIRHLLEACHLPWDEQCLNFHAKKRAIATASVWQARQPIYKSSTKRWSNYAQFLQGFANRISDYLDEEDIEEFAKHGIKIRKKWRLGFGR